MKSRISRHRALTIVGTVFLSLIFAQLPNTSAPAVVYCIGPAAYPPDLPDCLDPVVEAKRVADAEASAAALAAASASADAAAAARQAELDKLEQDALLSQLQSAEIDAAAKRAKKLADDADYAASLAKTAADNAEKAENSKKTQIADEKKAAADALEKKQKKEALAREKELLAAEKEKEVQEKIAAAAEELRKYEAVKAELLAEIDKANKKRNELDKIAKAEKERLDALQSEIDNAQGVLRNAETQLIALQAEIDLLAKPEPKLRTKVFVFSPEVESETGIFEGKFTLSGKTLEQLQVEQNELEEAKKTASNKILTVGPQLDAVKVSEGIAKTQAETALKEFNTASTNQEKAFEKVSLAASEASNAQSEKTTLDNEALIARTEAARAELERSIAVATAARREAELIAVQAARAATDAAALAAKLRAEALAKTSDALQVAVSSSEGAADARLIAVAQLKVANVQSQKAQEAAADSQAAAAQSAALAEKAAKNAQDALDRQRAAEEDLRNANERAAEARRVAEAAAAARAAAEAAGKPKPMSDKEYSLLVAAAKKEAEDAAVKKAADEKAKTDAEEAAKKEEDAKKAAVDPNQAAVDAARKKADAAIAEAERLAAKADADIAAANEKAAAAIEAAKAKAQQIIDGIKSNLGKVASSASAAVDKYRGKANQSSDKADVAKQALEDANAKVNRTAEIEAAVATEFKTIRNQISNFEVRAQIQVAQEKIQSAAISKTQSEIQQAIKNYERIRIDISSYLLTYNAAKKSADEASLTANQKRDIAARSKIIADNAVGAYQEASGVKKLISTEKPFTVASAPDGVNVQTKVSAADLAKLKQLADQAVARYNQDAKAADVAQQAAEKLIAAFEKVKFILEAKVATGKKLQESIRSMQDELKVKRGVLEQTTFAKDALLKKIRLAQSKATQTRNELTIAQVEAQKAKLIAEKVKLIVARHQNDAKNANTVVDANQIAVEATKQAAIDIESSSNSIDKIVASTAVNNSIASLPMIFSAVAIATAAAFFGTLAVRRYRRRGSAPLPTFTEPDLDIQFDFDRILAEVRAKVVKRKARTTTAKATTVRRAAPKKR